MCMMCTQTDTNTHTLTLSVRAAGSFPTQCVLVGSAILANGQMDKGEREKERKEGGFVEKKSEALWHGPINSPDLCCTALHAVVE